MTTNDERREAARELRGLTNVVLVEGELGLEYDESKQVDYMWFASESVDRLADLIEPDMDVWRVCEDDERGIHAEKLHVGGVDDDGMAECLPSNGGTWVYLDSSELHVKKPVLDADGVPIKEGDTVWLTGEPEFSWTVTDVSERHVGGYCNEDGGGLDMHSKSLTHTKPEPPDSWERIEDDATMPPDACEGGVRMSAHICGNCRYYVRRPAELRARMYADGVCLVAGRATHSSSTSTSCPCERSRQVYGEIPKDWRAGQWQTV